MNGWTQKFLFSDINLADTATALSRGWVQNPINTFILTSPGNMLMYITTIKHSNRKSDLRYK